MQRRQAISNGNGNGGGNTPTLNCDQSASGIKQNECSDFPNPEAQGGTAMKKLQTEEKP